METTLNNETMNSTILPKWINARLFDDMMRIRLPEYNKLQSFSVKQHACQVFGINVGVMLKDDKVRNMAYHLVVKPLAASATEGGISIHSFTREAEVYHKLLPTFENLYHEVELKMQFAPTFYQFGQQDCSSTILLDDMASKGYRNVTRKEGLNMLHTQEVLKKLAALHAASAVVFERRSSELRIFSKPVMDAVSYSEYENKAVAYTRKFVENLRPLDLREYQDHIKLYLKNFRKNLVQVEKVDPNEFNVLNHGDCRAHNILFKYDAFGNILDTIFVDFQKSKYGSPAQDLLYFIFSSVQLEDKLKHFDFFIKYYHDHLTKYLKLLKYSKQLPKLTDLHFAILNKSVWAFAALFQVLPFVSQDCKENLSVDLTIMTDTKLGESNYFDLMFRNPSYAEQVQKILPWLENRAFLEI